MSSTNKKILVSGCGFSWSGQKRHTWPKILKSVGNKIDDVGGPAVSNQWVLNNVIETLNRDQTYDLVIIQLTTLNKLDVDIGTKERYTELVEKDTLRNFTYKDVWPSSLSEDHQSKQLYNKWLSSPRLEKQDLWCKLFLLKEYCEKSNIQLYVLQGYFIDWSESQKTLLNDIISNINSSLYSDYKNSKFYKNHDFTNENTVPCVSYQIQLAKDLTNKLDLIGIDKLSRLAELYG